MPQAPRYETIQLEIDGPIASLQLARPATLNALSRQMLGEMIGAIDELRARPDIRVLLLSAQGRGFSSGADLSSGGAPSPGGKFDGGDVLEHFYNP